MPGKEDLKNLAESRQKGLHDREATQEERLKIQKRRHEIEERRRTLAHGSSDAGAKELFELQHEVVELQERIVELQLVSEQQLEVLAALKRRANGLWHDLELIPEASQLRLETIQGFAEAIQKLHEEVQKQEEGYERRASHQ
jgi:hypothetical protein